MYRKFLLYKNDDLSVLVSDKKFINKEIFFIQIDRCKSIYYLAESKSYKRIEQGAKTTIVNVPKKEYKDRKKDAIGKVLEKKVYELDDNSTITLYNEGFAFLEKNFDNIEKLSKFFKSDFFKIYVDEDVTNNINFNEYSLSKFNQNGLNIYKIFKNIKNNRSYEMKKVIYKEMNSVSAIRIELFLLYTKLLKNKNEILSKSLSGEDLLSKYRKNMLKIIIILKEYHDIFEKDIVKHVIKNLEHIYSHTDVHHDIVSIRENFALIEGCMENQYFKEFLETKDSEISSQVNNFISFLKTKEYAIILKQLELLIKEGSVEENIDLEDSIELSLSKKIKKRLKKFKKVFLKNIDCNLVDEINKIVYNLKKLELLRKEFNYLLEDDKHNAEKVVLEELKANLDKYYYLLKLENILVDGITQKKYKECLEIDITNKKTKLLKNIKKSFKKM